MEHAYTHLGKGKSEGQREFRRMSCHLPSFAPVFYIALYATAAIGLAGQLCYRSNTSHSWAAVRGEYLMNCRLQRQSPGCSDPQHTSIPFMSDRACEQNTYKAAHYELRRRAAPAVGTYAAVQPETEGTIVSQNGDRDSPVRTPLHSHEVTIVKVHRLLRCI